MGNVEVLPFSARVNICPTCIVFRPEGGHVTGQLV